jgi:hypothetical protein
MKNICIDLMAKGDSHCCHHMGILKYYPKYFLYLHNSSNLIEANLYYYGSKLNMDNIKYYKTLILFLLTIKSLFYKDKVIFAGLHLRQAVLLLPIIAFNGRVTIHLHGQAYGLKNKSIKYILWRFISFFATLEVGNPAWKGPSFVNIIKNINELHYPKFYEKNNKVLIYSQKGIRPTNLEILIKKLEKKNLEIVLIKSGISYQELDQIFRSVSYIYLDYCSDYYNFSPCGHISDAINYGLKIALNTDDILNILVVNKYPVNYLLI